MCVSCLSLFFFPSLSVWAGVCDSVRAYGCTSYIDYLWYGCILCVCWKTAHVHVWHCYHASVLNIYVPVGAWHGTAEPFRVSNVWVCLGTSLNDAGFNNRKNTGERERHTCTNVVANLNSPLGTLHKECLSLFLPGIQSRNRLFGSLPLCDTYPRFRYRGIEDRGVTRTEAFVLRVYNILLTLWDAPTTTIIVWRPRSSSHLPQNTSGKSFVSCLQQYWCTRDTGIV